MTSSVPDINKKAITRAAESASDDPDLETQEYKAENRKAKTAGIRADDSEEELRSDLRQEAARLREWFHTHSDELKELRPEVAKLRQAINSNRAINWMSVTLPAIGGALITVATVYYSGNTVAFARLTSWGLASISIGVIALFLQSAFNWPHSRQAS